MKELKRIVQNYVKEILLAKWFGDSAEDCFFQDCIIIC